MAIRVPAATLPQLISYRFLSGNGKVYSIGCPPQNAGRIPGDADWKNLENELRCKSPQETADRLCSYIDGLYPLVYNFVYLIQPIYELLIRLNYAPSKANWDYFTDNAFWSSHENRNEILLLIKEEISLTCLSKSPEDDLPVTERAKAFLTEHYREPISMEMLAESFHLNPRYFSTLFKKKEGAPLSITSPGYGWMPPGIFCGTRTFLPLKSLPLWDMRIPGIFIRCSKNIRGRRRRISAVDTAQLPALPLRNGF